MTERVREILSWYAADNVGVKANLYRLLNTGRLAGTGKMIILPIDQGFEHGPARTFAMNPAAYDVRYHFQLAIEAGLTAYAAPLGALEAAADEFAGQLPTILKLNSSNSLSRAKEAPSQAVTGTVDDALRLGCTAVGLTIYPGSDDMFEMFEFASETVAEAKAVGLPTVIWSYPRGGGLSKEGELAVDVGAYAAHMAALLGAHIVKVKLPTAFIEQPEAKKVYEDNKVDVSTLPKRVQHVVQTLFSGRRLVVFSGGASKGAEAVIEDARAIRDGGGNGSIIGRNSFQRSREDALKLLDTLVNIYLGKA
jgi:class I fructose-bisphosphate aldolase